MLFPWGEKVLKMGGWRWIGHASTWVVILLLWINSSMIFPIHVLCDVYCTFDSIICLVNRSICMLWWFSILAYVQVPSKWVKYGREWWKRSKGRGIEWEIHVGSLFLFLLSVSYRKSNGITLIVVLDLLLGLGVSRLKRH